MPPSPRTRSTRNFPARIWPGCAPAIIGRGSGPRRRGGAWPGSIPRRAERAKRCSRSAAPAPEQRAHVEEAEGGRRDGKAETEDGEHEERRGQRGRERVGEDVVEQRR